MQFSRRHTEDFLSSWEERDALARAEYLCDQAETLHLEALAEAARISEEARIEAAGLINRALATIDQTEAEVTASLRRQHANEQAAVQARHDAELLMESLQAQANQVAAASAQMIDLRELAHHPA
jgi:hypothetical protein